MLTDAAALTNGLSMAIDGLRVVGGVVCAGGVSFGGRFSSQIENLLPYVEYIKYVQDMTDLNF
jgi:hypothetical protein